MNLRFDGHCIHTAGIIAVTPLAIVASHTGCGGCLCELNSMEYAVTVVDGAGDPVVGLEHTVRIARTGQALTALSWEGRYSLISDEQKHLINPRGEPLLFTATDGRRTVGADYVADVPGSVTVTSTRYRVPIP